MDLSKEMQINEGFSGVDSNQVEKVIFGSDRKKTALSNGENAWANAIDEAIVTFKDGHGEIIDFKGSNEVISFCEELSKSGIELSGSNCYKDTETWKTLYKQVKKAGKKPLNKGVLGLIAGLSVALGAGSTYAGVKLVNDNENESKSKRTREYSYDIEREVVKAYGIYKYDLSQFEGINEYYEMIPDSMQKQNTQNYMNILSTFNKEVDLVDGTKQLGGLTIEQLIAIDAYSNSNVYSVEDYIKTFGLYDFTNVNTNFEQGTLAVGAYLANSDVDASVLADIFKDEDVKNAYLKMVSFRNDILTAEDSKSRKNAIGAFEKYMEEVAIDQASGNYLDYNEHPGMAFVTSAMVISLNYNNVSYSNKLISEVVVLGTDDKQSKLDTICSNANAKMEDVEDFVLELNKVLADNEIIKEANRAIIKKAARDLSEPVVTSLAYEELDKLLTEVLCDQVQINELMGRELMRNNQFVTVEDQRLINANAIQLSRKLQATVNGGHYANESIAKLASQLQKVGDTAVVSGKDVNNNDPKAQQQMAASSQGKAAKDKLNSSTGMLPYETEADKQQTDAKINSDVQSTNQEGVNYVNEVIAYYEAHGNVDGVPGELQDAKNNLTSENWNSAKSTGINRYDAKNNQTVGGEIHIDITTDSDSNEPEVVTPYEEPKAEEKPSEPTPAPSEPTPAPSEPVEKEVTIDNGDGTTTTGTISSEFDGIDIGNISTDPNSTAPQSITEDMIDAYIDSLTQDEYTEIISPFEEEVGYSK